MGIPVRNIETWFPGRRSLCAVAIGAWLAPFVAAAQGGAFSMEVWKSPTCGCCKDWIKHMETHGFSVKVYDIGNTAMRQRLSVPVKLGSCHTALVSGYAVEGHVPAPDVLRLLKERPDAVGLTVPGMPIGAPGMDGPAYRNRRDPYDALLIAKDGSTRVFQPHR